MKYAQVQFTNRSRGRYNDIYVYKIPAKMKLEKYDTVLVSTQYGYTLATVISLDEEQCQISEGSVRTIAEKIKSKTMDGVNKLRKLDEIKRTLDKKIEELDEAQKYRMYAEIDPEVATLIGEIEELSK